MSRTSIEALAESFLKSCSLMGEVGMMSMSSSLTRVTFSCSSTPWLCRDFDKDNMSPEERERDNYIVLSARKCMLIKRGGATCMVN